MTDLIIQQQFDKDQDSSTKQESELGSGKEKQQKHESEQLTLQTQDAPPETKTKTETETETETETDDPFPVGTLVWAKVPGYAWWPAKVEAVADLPTHVIDSKPGGSSATTIAKPVYFFGSQEFGWIKPDCLRPYEKYKEELSKKNKQKQFVKGLAEIQDPSTWPRVGQFEGHGLGLAQVQDPEHRRKSTGSALAAKKKRKRNTEDPSLLKKKMQKVKPEMSKLDRLMKLRIKLQVFLQQKEPPQEADYEKASAYLTETEAFDMDVHLFKETKIGKVVKHLSKKGVVEHDISTRCKTLTEKWMSELKETLKDQEGNQQGTQQGNQQGTQQGSSNVKQEIAAMVSPSAANPNRDNPNQEVASEGFAVAAEMTLTDGQGKSPLKEKTLGFSLSPKKSSTKSKLGLAPTPTPAPARARERDENEDGHAAEQLEPTPDIADTTV